MPEEESKAKVISQNPRAQVVEDPKRKKRAIVIERHGLAKVVPTELGIPSDPDKFSKYCRELLGLKPNDSLWNEDLQELSEKLELNPIAFYNSGDHWTLILEYYKGQLTIYDPPSGVRSLEYGPAQKVWYFPKPKYLESSAADLSKDGYKILQEPLQQLGPIQRNPADCGPLSLFAANFVKNTQRQR